MYMVREVIHCKPGTVSDLANKFKAVGEIMRTMDLEPHRLYTDLSGEPFWTLVVEREYESLDQAQALESKVFGDERSRAAMEGYHELIESGRREFYRVVS
jgi:hypothetical protein